MFKLRGYAGLMGRTVGCSCVFQQSSNVEIDIEAI